MVAPLREDLHKNLHTCHKPRQVANLRSKRICFQHTVVDKKKDNHVK